MKYLFAVLLALTVGFLWAQTENTETSLAEPGKFQVGITFSPDLGYRILSNNGGGQTAAWLIDARNEEETFKPGFTAGLNLCFRINNYLGLETGVHYASRGYQTKKYDVIGEPGLAAEYPEQMKFRYNLFYVEMPLRANVTIGQGKVRFIGSLGIIAGLLTQQTQVDWLYYPDRTERDAFNTDIDYNQLQLSPSASAGIDCRLSKRINLRVEPVVRYGMLDIIDAPVTGTLYSAGVSMGCYVRL